MNVTHIYTMDSIRALEDGDNPALQYLEGDIDQQKVEGSEDNEAEVENGEIEETKGLLARGTSSRMESDHVSSSTAAASINDSKIFRGVRKYTEQAFGSKKHDDIIRALTDKDKALYMWANIIDLDIFLRDIYQYFIGHGKTALLVSQILYLCTVAFVLAFSTFLFFCTDLSKLPISHKLADIRVPHCTRNMPLWFHAILFVVSVGLIMQLFNIFVEAGRLERIKQFYTGLLDVPNSDIQTVSWQYIEQGITKVANTYPTARPSQNRSNYPSDDSTGQLDALKIANRIMRTENYFIALINENVLDLSVPLIGGNFITKYIEWTLDWCIFKFAFDQNGQLREEFKSTSNAKILAKDLRKRYLFAAVFTFLFGPVLVIFLLVYSALRSFNDFRQNPSNIGYRFFTPYALWKFREFNELQHIFDRRMKLCLPKADDYVKQFPDAITNHVAKFISFIAGSFAAVLAFFSLIDPELFLGFEITKDRTALFYIGLFASIAAIFRSLITETGVVASPEASLREVCKHTHYMPENWKGRLHTSAVKKEFLELYDFAIINFAREILSVIVTPVILCFSLPRSAEKTIKFLRDFSVHVDDLGYVCSYALFEFSRSGHVKQSPEPVANHGDSNEDKMGKSYYNFLATHKNWTPSDLQHSSIQNTNISKSLNTSKLSHSNNFNERENGIRRSRFLSRNFKSPLNGATMHNRVQEFSFNNQANKPSSFKIPSEMTIRETEPEQEFNTSLQDFESSFLTTSQALKEGVNASKEEQRGVIGLMNKLSKPTTIMDLTSALP